MIQEIKLKSGPFDGQKVEVNKSQNHVYVFIEKIHNKVIKYIRLDESTFIYAK